MDKQLGEKRRPAESAERLSILPARAGVRQRVQEQRQRLARRQLRLPRAPQAVRSPPAQRERTT